MANNENLGASFSIDITALKAGLAQANRLIRESESEFKAAASGIDDWATSQDGLTARIKHLNNAQDLQKKKIDALKKEYQEQISKGIDPTSAAMVKLRTDINKEQEALNKTEKELKQHTQALKEMQDESEDTESALKKLIKSLTNTGEAAEDAGDGFTVTKGAIANLVSDGISNLIGACGNAISSLANLSKETQEYREDIGKLKTAWESAGKSTELATATYKEFYSVLGEEDRSVEAVNHLAKFVDTEQDMAKWTDICTGVWGTFGDSLPIEGLTEASNETAKVGKLTGVLADALNWAGVNEDKFQASLDKCNGEQERAKLITDTLNGLYSEAAGHYKENNASIIAARKATSDYTDSMAELGEELEPINTAVNEMKNDFIKGLVPALKTGAIPAVKSFVSELKASGTVEKFSTGIASLANNILPTLGNVLKFVGEHIEGVITAVFALGTAFATLKAISAVSTAITAATTAIGALAAGTGTATVAMTGFNAVMAANPIGAVLTAVGLLTAGILLLANSEEEATEKTDLLSESQREAVTAAQEQAEAYKETKAAADEIAASNMANVDYVRNNLLPQLQQIVDSNGNVKQGYEERASFIMGELNTALGTEYTSLSQIIDANGQIKQSIYDVIEAKKAQILLEAYEDSYREAVEKVAAAEKARATQAQELAAQQVIYDEAYKKARDARLELDEKVANAKTEADLRSLASEAKYVSGLETEAAKQKGILDDKKAAYDESEANLYGYYQDINNYQTASTLVMSGETDKAIGYLNNLGSGFQTAASVAGKSAEEQKKILRQQVIDTEVNARLMRKSYEQGVEGVTEDMVKTAEEQANQAKTEFVKVGGNLTDGIAKGAEENQWTLTGAMARIVDNAVEAARKAGIIKSPSRKMRDKVGKELAAGVAVGIEQGTSEAEKSAEEMANKVINAAQKNLDNYKIYNDLSPDEEADYWNNVRTQIQEGTQARINADKKYFDALKTADSEFLSQSQKDLDNWKVYHDVSLQDEVQYWDDVRNQIQEGTQARIDADKKYFTAQENYEKDHNTKVKTAQEKLQSDLLKLQKEYTDKLEKIENKRLEAEKKHYEKLKSITSTAMADIETLRNNYDDKLSSRTSDIFNSYGLFDTAEISEASGSQLTEALQSQVDAIKLYSTEINKLKKRVRNQDLIAELESAGVSATGNIQALNNMSSTELDNYVKLYSQKKKLASKQAETELSSLYTKTETQIQKIQANLERETENIEKAYALEVEYFEKEHQNAVNALISNGADIGKEHIADFKELGINLIDGMIEGFKSNEWNFAQEVTNSITNAVKAAQEVAGIHSPSTLMRDKIGVNLGLGLVEGVKNTTSKLVGAVKNQISTVKQTYDLNAINDKVSGSNSSNPVNNGGNVVINQTNNYSQAHSRYEIYKSKQQTAAAVRLAMGV